MRVLEINSVCGIRSTGRICTDIADVLKNEGHTCKIGFGRFDVPEQYQEYAIRIGNPAHCYLDAAKTYFLDAAGFFSKNATKKFLKVVDEYHPDLIHLHNIHGYYINIFLLFDYIKKHNIPTVWTLHDCWAFTGHCTHFSEFGCNKWKTICDKCPQKSEYPKSVLFDFSKRNFLKKKELFAGVEKITLVTPSQWLERLLKDSFLGTYSSLVIPNGIDLSVFHPTESDFKIKHHLENKIMVLGVATSWSEHKGLSRYNILSSQLGNNYQIVLVGLTRKQIEALPPEIIGIEKTNSPEELAAIYTAADVHISLSVEETMGLTIIESNACGTPVIVFNESALPEIVTPQTGIVLNESTTEAMINELKSQKFMQLNSESCIKYASNYAKHKMYMEYLKLYKEMIQ